MTSENTVLRLCAAGIALAAAGSAAFAQDYPRSRSG